jgi:ADP-ribose pyrophosphatase YjhB (NUDIX family)
VKPLKRSLSLVIEGARGLLIVRRPDDDESLPGLWGLPAVSLEVDEPEHDAVRRAGTAKLGVNVRPLGVLGEAQAERPDQRIVMRDWRAELASGEPSVPQPGAGTQYTELRWGTPADLVPAARAGSLCCRVLLRERGLDWET